MFIGSTNMTNVRQQRPTSLEHAMKLCIAYAKDRHNLSVERIADIMNCDIWRLYKWMKIGNMPVQRITGFEHTCGINYVTQWFAINSNKLLIDIPSINSNDQARDIQRLQLAVTHATLLAIENKDPDKTITTLTAAMEQIAWHRERIIQEMEA